MKLLKIAVLVNVAGLLFAGMIALNVHRVQSVYGQEGDAYKAEIVPIEGGAVMYVDGFPPIPQPQTIDIYCIGNNCQFIRPLSPDPVWTDPNQPDEFQEFCYNEDGELVECPEEETP